MPNVLQYSPGQTVTIFHQILNSDGYRANGYVANDGYVIYSHMADGYLFDGYTINSHTIDGYVADSIADGYWIDGYEDDGYIIDGYVVDGYGAPIIARIIRPDFSLFVIDPPCPVAMTYVDTGLYTFSFVLPTGAAAVGTYIVDIFWYHPTTLCLQQDYIQVVVNAPYGIYSAVSGS
jgi:hypothetical protein